MPSATARTDVTLDAVDGEGPGRLAWALVALAAATLASSVWALRAPLPRGCMVLVLGVTVAEHPARERILARLALLPGDHFRSIARALKLSPGEARHHLNVLLRRRRIREDRKNGRCRYYVQHSVHSDRNEAFEKFWAYRDLRLRVLHLARDRGTASPSDVATVLGISRQLAGYHLLRLAEIGYVRREGGRYRPLGEPPKRAVRQKPN